MFKSSVRNTVVWQFAKNLTDFISSISGQPHQQSLPALPNCAGCSQTRRSGCSWCRLRGVSPLPSPPLAGHHLPAKIYHRFISDRAAPRAPPQPAAFRQAGLKEPRLEMLQLRSHGQAGEAASGSRVEDRQGAQWWVQFQEELKGEGSPLGVFQWLHPTEQVFHHCKRSLLCCFQHNTQKHAAKKLHRRRQILLLSPGDFGHQEACIHFY